MNGPTEREQWWKPGDGDTVCQKCGQDNGVWWVSNETWNCYVEDKSLVLCPDCFVARVADRESATLRARVAVLEQQTAAIEALIDEAVDEARGQASTDGPVDPGMLLEYLARISAALAAGVDPKGSMVVDNPTEDEANADPFTLDDLGHPTEEPS